MFVMQVRTLIQRELVSSLQKFDALVSPVSPMTAWKLGEVIDDPLTMYKSDVMTVNLNLAGQTLLQSWREFHIWPSTYQEVNL